MSWLEVTAVSCNSQSQERPYQTLTDQLEAAKHPDRSNELKLSGKHSLENLQSSYLEACYEMLIK